MHVAIHCEVVLLFGAWTIDNNSKVSDQLQFLQAPSGVASSYDMCVFLAVSKHLEVHWGFL